jgi:hypothetical protein
MQKADPINRFFKFAAAPALALGLTACATSPPEAPIRTRETVELQGNCARVTTTTRSQEVNEEQRVLDSLQSMTFDNLCAEFQVLALLGKTELQNEEGAIVSAAMVLALTSSSPEIRDLVQRGMARLNMTQADLEQRVAEHSLRNAQTQITEAVSRLRGPNGEPDYAVYNYVLNELYEGRAIEGVALERVRQEVRTALQAQGTSYEQIKIAYEDNRRTLPVNCTTVRQPNGAMVWDCSRQ